jgi:tripartite-type tricarboxylate transporter receptor subunit TctC
MRPTRRLLLATLPLLAAPAVLRAQGAFPTKPIQLIVPFPPGGTTDVTMRALAEAASKHLPQPILIDNRPGAANTLGAAAVARARPDGYLLTQLPASAIRVQILQKLPYDPVKDFSPIANTTGYTFGVICAKDRYPGGWKDLVAAAKQRPGEISIGNTGANGTPHVTMMELALREGIELNHIAYRGDADGAQAVLGGHIDAHAGASGLGTLVDSGKAKWLHVWSGSRLAHWPDAPTLVELGYQDMVVTTPFGVVGPAGMDPAAVKLLQDAFAAAARDPAYIALLDRYDMLNDYRNSDDYAAYIRALVKQEEATIKRLNLRM